MFHGKTIALIDDSKTVLNVFREYFYEKHPNNTFVVYNDFTYDFMLNVDLFDAVILDYLINPKITTETMIKEIKLARPDMFILCMSSSFYVNQKNIVYFNKKAMKNCINSGADRVSHKDVEEVFDMLDKHFQIKEKLSP